MKVVHYDLFAGIGGFSLAIDEVFHDKTIEHIFCEWESFPTAVLRQHWPAGRFYGDIVDLVADTNGQGLPRQQLEAEATRRHDESDRGRSDKEQSTFTIVTGGFPCQPFSHAGRRQGTADDRYQWPNMFKVIRNTKPEWVIAENVRGLVTWNEGMVLETVCADLEGEGYEVQPLIIPAVAVNAPHRRDRVWIIAHAKSQRPSARLGLEREQDTQATEQRRQDSDAANTERERRESRRGDRLEACQEVGREGQQEDERHQLPDWEQDWREVAFATCNDSMDDGLSRIVDGVPYSKAQWRKQSLKAYGNGIVHQVALEIIRSIRIAEGSL